MSYMLFIYIIDKWQHVAAFVYEQEDSSPNILAA